MTQGICDGRNECFEQLYNEFFDFVYFHVQQTTGRDQATCLDIAQDSWMKIIRSMKPIEHRFQLAAWIRAVTRSVTYDWLRKETRRNAKQTKFEQSAAGATIRQLDEGNSAEETIHSIADQDLARLHWIKQELSELPPDIRSMIAFRYRLGWTLQKIADRFGLKTGAVDGRIRRTVSRLKQKAESAEQQFSADQDSD